MNRYTSTASRQPRVVNQKTATHPKTQNLKRRIPLTIGGKTASISTFVTTRRVTCGLSLTNPMTVHQLLLTVRCRYCHGLRSRKKHPTNSTPTTTLTYPELSRLSSTTNSNPMCVFCFPLGGLPRLAAGRPMRWTCRCRFRRVDDSVFGLIGGRGRKDTPLFCCGRGVWRVVWVSGVCLSTPSTVQVRRGLPPLYRPLYPQERNASLGNTAEGFQSKKR